MIRGATNNFGPQQTSTSQTNATSAVVEKNATDIQKAQTLPSKSVDELTNQQSANFSQTSQIESHSQSSVQEALDPSTQGPQGSALDFGLDSLPANSPLRAALYDVGLQLLKTCSLADARKTVQRIATTPLRELTQADYQLLRSVPADKLESSLQRILALADRRLFSSGNPVGANHWLTAIGDQFQLTGVSALDVLAVCNIEKNLSQFGSEVHLTAPDNPRNPDGSFRLRLAWDMDAGSSADAFVLHYGFTSRGDAKNFEYEHTQDMGMPPMVPAEGGLSYEYNISNLFASDEFFGRQVHLAVTAKNGALESELSEELSAVLSLERDDVDGRGEVDLADVAYLLELLSNGTQVDWKSTGRLNWYVDVNSDGNIDRQDVLTLLRTISTRSAS